MARPCSPSKAYDPPVHTVVPCEYPLDPAIILYERLKIAQDMVYLVLNNSMPLPAERRQQVEALFLALDALRADLIPWRTR